MSSKLDAFESCSKLPKARGVKMPAGSVDVVVMFLKAEDQKPIAEGKKYAPPRKFHCLVLAPVIVQRKIANEENTDSKKNETADLMKGVLPKEENEEKKEVPLEPYNLEPFVKTEYFGIFNPPKETVDSLVRGGIYTMRGVVYDSFKSEDYPEPLISYTAKQILPSERKFEEFYPAIPFKSRCFDVKRDCVQEDKTYEEKAPQVLIAMQLEQDSVLRRALCETTPALVAKLVLPDDIDARFLLREAREEKPEQIAFTGGTAAGGQGYAKPMMLAYQKATEEDPGTTLAIGFGGYASDWAPLQLDLVTWPVLGALFLPKVTGHVIGSVDRKTTAGFNKMPDVDDTVVISSTVLLDVPEMIRRVGFRVPGKDIAGFLPYNVDDLRSAEWATSRVNLNKNLDVLNLYMVTGDASKIVEEVTKCDNEANPQYACYVVTSHGLDEEEVLALRQDPDLVNALKDHKKMRPAKKGVYAVYVVGHKIRGLLEPAGVKKMKMIAGGA